MERDDVPGVGQRAGRVLCEGGRGRKRVRGGGRGRAGEEEGERGMMSGQGIREMVGKSSEV